MPNQGEALNIEFLASRADAIREAAEGCPAEVIKFETGER